MSSRPPLAPEAHSPLRLDPAFPARWFPPDQVREGADAEDLREMGKFTEHPNILGLPAHPIRSPVTGPILTETDSLPPEIESWMAERFRTEPVICVRGDLAAGCERPVRLALVVSQWRAHLAAFFEAVLFPPPVSRTDAGPRADPLDLCIVIVEDTPGQAVLHVPGRKLAVSLGTDDPRVPLFVALESAHRIWSARNERIRATKPPPGEAAGEEIRILPGGSFCFTPTGPADSSAGPGTEAPATLFFAGETLAHNHPEPLRERMRDLGAVPSAEILFGGSQPLLALGGGLVAPVLRAPILPASLAAAAPGLLDAAHHPDSLPFGIDVDPSGRLKTAESEDGFFVLPSATLPPAPVSEPTTRIHSSLSGPRKIGRLLCLANARPEAMDLWAIGFPAPQEPGAAAAAEPSPCENSSPPVPDRPI